MPKPFKGTINVDVRDCSARIRIPGWPTIDRVAIHVSGEPYLDLEREATLMLMRE